MLIVDTGVLLAAADDADQDHDTCVRLLEDEPGPFITTGLVVAETCYLVERQLGPASEATFFRSLAAGDIEVQSLADHDWARPLVVHTMAFILCAWLHVARSPSRPRWTAGCSGPPSSVASRSRR